MRFAIGRNCSLSIEKQRYNRYFLGIALLEMNAMSDNGLEKKDVVMWTRMIMV